MQTLRIDRKIVQADWQWLSMRNRSPDALYWLTTASKFPISPGRAPMPMRKAETDPSALAGAEANRTMEKAAAASTLSARTNPGNLCMSPLPNHVLWFYLKLNTM
jgi:hypothetical protein